MCNDRFRKVHELAAQFRPVGPKWGQVFKNPPYSNQPSDRRTRNKLVPSTYGNPSSRRVVTEQPFKLIRSVLRFGNCNGHALNETQKPVGLLGVLLAYSCPEGGLVLDPFSGAGSTLVEAKARGLKAIGIEKRLSQCEATIERLERSLF